MPGTVKLTRNDYSRMWLIPWTAGPANAPVYEGWWKAGAASVPLGDRTLIYAPDEQQYGKFEVAGSIIGQPGQPELPVTARYRADQKSTLLRLANLGCDSDLQVHFGSCQNPSDFNGGWDKILVLEGARPTEWGTTDLGALTPDDSAVVDEEVPFSGERLYEIARITFGEKAASQIVQEIVAITVCDAVTCGSCGIPSNGCDKVLAVTLSNGGSPGLPAEVIYSSDGGDSWGDTIITTLGATENPSDGSCLGVNYVVVSEASESLHWAPIADILAGNESWAEVTTGFVALKGPLAISVADARNGWIVGEGGYVYKIVDAQEGVTVQDGGSATAQDLNDVHALDADNVLAVGASNAVIFTQNGGEVWGSVTGPAVGVALNCCWMKSADEWFVGTATGRLYYTRDAGTNWAEKTFVNSGTGTILDIAFSSNSVGYMSYATAAAAGAGRILRTIDGGYSWYVAPEGNTSIPANDFLNSLAVCESDVNTVFAGGRADNGTDGIIVKGA